MSRTVASSRGADRNPATLVCRTLRLGRLLTGARVETTTGRSAHGGRTVASSRPKMEAAVARTGTRALEIVRRCDRHRFVVLPKRWIVERTLAWISRCRRLARDYERHTRTAAAFVHLAMIRLLLRRLSACS